MLKSGLIGRSELKLVLGIPKNKNSGCDRLLGAVIGARRRSELGRGVSCWMWAPELGREIGAEEGGCRVVQGWRAHQVCASGPGREIGAGKDCGVVSGGYRVEGVLGSCIGSRDGGGVVRNRGWRRGYTELGDLMGRVGD